MRSGFIASTARVESAPSPTGRKRVLFIGGSLNQTTQMHQVARALPECESAFTPYYVDGLLEILRRRRLLEFTIVGFKLQKRCLDYLHREGLAVDMNGGQGSYDLVVSCSDLVVPRNLRGQRLVVVQEGILDPPDPFFRLWKRLRFLPRWIGGTAATGLSGRYDRYCVASPGYRDDVVALGADPEKVVVTGIPNFDECRRYAENRFPYRHYVLACTSDARETFKGDDRKAFIESVLALAAGRQVIFKLHPNENVARATREIGRVAPGALVYSRGSAEEMIANCDVLVTQYSSTVFVGLALGKEVHSYFDLPELRRLLPLQNGCAAANIAAVCRELLGDEAASGTVAREGAAYSSHVRASARAGAAALAPAGAL